MSEKWWFLTVHVSKIMNKHENTTILYLQLELSLLDNVTNNAYTVLKQLKYRQQYLQKLRAIDESVCPTSLTTQK